MKLKKLLSAGLVFSMIISTHAFALETDVDLDIDSTSFEVKRSSLFINGDSGELSDSALSDEDIFKMIETLDSARARNNIDSHILGKLKAVSEASKSMLTKKNQVLGVKLFTQDTSYYCGPATVKQTLHYINGSSPSQSTIASGIGTTTAGSALQPMVNYINSRINSRYVIVSKPSKNRILQMVEYGVDNYMPVICRLKFSRGGSWKYTTGGHFLNAHGYNSYGDEIVLTDPYIQWIDSSAGGSYWVSLTELHTATQSHFAQEMAF